MKGKKHKVFAMMSGGVDSSLSAALLVEQGYDVTGVFMKNWSESIPGVIECTSEADAADARAVAEHIGIPFYIWDFEQEYKDKVFMPMIEEYRTGRTPNPDVNCNSEVKFKVFLERAITAGADYVASGHYARVSPNFELLAGIDRSKDQSYFLNRLTEAELSRTLFPIGEMKKQDVRAEAEKRGIPTARKKDSQGLCFVGEVSFKQVLKRYIPSRTGQIVTTDGEVISEHDGAEFVTIGQRNGLGIGGGTPYFVVDKDVAANTITVARGYNNPDSFTNELFFDNASWVNDEPETPLEILARIRYRAPLEKSTLYKEGKSFRLEFADPQKAITPGQSVVLYDDERVLGGGIISKPSPVSAR